MMQQKRPTFLADAPFPAFQPGQECGLYEKMGAQLAERDGVPGVSFRIWAPNAREISVIGDFNHWSAGAHALRSRADHSGIWEGFCPGIGAGSLYKYHIVSNHKATQMEKGDPFAFCWECPPKTASCVTDLSYRWEDTAWMQRRKRRNALESPIAIYEMHLGSWRRAADDGSRFLSYRELAGPLVAYLQEMGFTHVEFMPVMEHPFYGSWGYQITGYFAPSRRFGAPQDLMFLIDQLHQNDIGVILDWVPSHFPGDLHGLANFDGTHLFEHADPRKGIHPDWDSYIFNYGRDEVQAFLVSNALFWLDKYHIDGLRMDAVASMLYLDYSRKAGEWIPNAHGGRENLEAIALIKRLNEAVYRHFPDVQTFAEESTAWPMVSRPTYLGGLGFGMKWNMGWMHDTLSYFQKDPVHRRHHHSELTFSTCYAFSENFLLPLSHDEVVHGKGALLEKMPGDEWQKFANLRLLFGYFYGHPGKKLLFMGGEFGQRREWHHDRALDWNLLQQGTHQGLRLWVRDLNHLYRSEAALYEQDFKAEGFEWVDCHDESQSVIAFLRQSKAGETLLFVFNFTPVPRYDYQLGAPSGGLWRERLNSDAIEYEGSGTGNLGRVKALEQAFHGRPFSLRIVLPPLAALVFKKKTALR